MVEMKNTSYVYANKALESAVRDLKSSFFDIFYHSQGTLLMLMKQLDELEVENEDLKEEAVDLINSQGTLLSDSMALVEELIRSIKKIDNNGKKIDKFNRSYVISRSKQFAKVDGKTVAASASAPVTEVATEVQTEPVTEAATEVKTEPVTEAATEVKTEPVTEAVTEVQTEPVTEAVTEVQTEPVTEAATEVKTEPVTEVATEVQGEVSEESTEVSTVVTGLELDPNAPVEEDTEPTTEKPKKYIADTPEGVVKDLKQALLTMPGMENLKFDSNGNPDFSSVLPQDVLDDFNSKFGFQVSVKKTLNKMENDDMNGETEAISRSETTVELPFALEPVIPTPAPPAPPAANSINQSELTTETVVEVSSEVSTEVNTEVTTEATSEVATEVATEAVIPGAQVVMPEVTTEATSKVTTEAATEAVIPGAQVVMPEVTTEATSKVTTEAVTESVIPGAQVVMPEVTTEATSEVTTEAATEAVIPGAQVVMPEVTTEATSEVTTEASTDLAMAGIQIAMPTEDASIEGQILPFGEVSTEAATEAITEAVTEAPTEDNSVRRFTDQSVNVRAILVSDNQFNKLAGSRVTQEALLTFKRILPEKGHSGTHLVTVDASQTAPAAVPSTENMTAEDKNRTIEAMMIDANNLYNAGKVAEAQALYDKISEINKTLVKS